MSRYFGRLTCPMCENKDSKKIRQKDDINRPIYYFSNGQKAMYHKRNVCTVCNYEW